MTALSDGARLVLLELDAPPRTPISAREIGELTSLGSREVGAYLRELRVAGLAVPLCAQTREPLERVPAGTRTVWAPA